MESFPSPIPAHPSITKSIFTETRKASTQVDRRKRPGLFNPPVDFFTIDYLGELAYGQEQAVAKLSTVLLTHIVRYGQSSDDGDEKAGIGTDLQPNIASIDLTA